MDRRNFLKTATVAAAGSVAPMVAHSTTLFCHTSRPESPNMIYRELGRTGERVSAIGMGGLPPRETAGPERKHPPDSRRNRSRYHVHG